MEFQWPPKTQQHTKVIVSAVLWALKEDGDIVDSPNAAGELWPRVERRGLPYPATSSLRSSLLSEMAGGRFGDMIERVYSDSGKTTRTLRLLITDLPPKPWSDEPAEPTERTDPLDLVRAVQERLDAELPEPRGVDAVKVALAGPAPEPTPEPVEAISDWSDLPIPDLAMMGLRIMSEVLVKATVAADVAQVESNDLMAQRLAAALEEAQRANERARKVQAQLAEATETIVARTAEARAVRKAKQQVEANLAALLRGERPSNDSGYRALDRTMREVPRTRAS